MSEEVVLLEPAATVIRKIGGLQKASEITGRHVTRIYRWGASKAAGGTDGFIPMPMAVKLLEYARANRIGLRPADFFPKA